MFKVFYFHATINNAKKYFLSLCIIWIGKTWVKLSKTKIRLHNTTIIHVLLERGGGNQQTRFLFHLKIKVICHTFHS